MKRAIGICGLSMLWILMVVLMAQSVALATETRVGTMGGTGMYVRDNSNIFYFPGAIHNYADQVVGEFRVNNDDDTYTVGGQMMIDDTHIFGVYLNRPVNFSVPVSITQDVILDRSTDLFFGLPIGDFNGAFRLSFGFDAFNDENIPDSAYDDVDETSSYFGLNFGLSNEKTDFSVMFEMPNIKREIGESTDSDVSTQWKGTGFGANFRTFLDKTDQLDIVPVLTAHYLNSSIEYKSADTTIDDYEVDIKRYTFGAGIGFNYHINENNMFVLGIEAIGYSGEKYDYPDVTENTTTDITMPGIYMGVESNIKSWLTGRFGAAQVYQLHKVKTDPEGASPTEVSTRLSEFKATFGLAIVMGNFSLDIAFNEGLLFDGPNFISGTEDNLADRISLTYEF